MKRISGLFFIIALTIVLAVACGGSAEQLTSTPIPIAPTNTPRPTVPPQPTHTGDGGGVLAFVSERSNGVPGIFLMNADGSDKRKLTAKFDTHPDWSPDGQRIAFSTRRANTVAIYVYDFSISRAQAITNTVRSPSSPDWSPDGETISMVYNPAHPGINFELYTMASEGEDFVRLTNSAGYQFFAGPDWSPDGSKLVFAADIEENFNIYVMELGQEEMTQLTFGEGNDRSPAWSPDGSQLAFASNESGNWEIYLMNADGSNMRNITNTASDEEWPAWSPDGTKLAFQTDRDGNWEIYLMDNDGNNLTRLTINDAKDVEPAWKPE